jgi:hypothetical protein
MKKKLSKIKYLGIVNWSTMWSYECKYRDYTLVTSGRWAMWKCLWLFLTHPISNCRAHHSTNRYIDQNMN